MNLVENPIGPRLIRNIILISTFFSIFATAVQLYSDYRDEVHLMNRHIENVKEASLDSIALNLWENNDKHINIQLENLLNFPNITFASIEEDNQETYSFGKNLEEDSIEKRYPLVYTYKNKEYELGELRLQAGLAQVRDRLKGKFYLIAITQTVKTFIVAFIILYLFYYMVTRHLNKMSSFAKDLSESENIDSFELNKTDVGDELDQLLNTLNLVRETIRGKLEKSKKSNEDLNHINAILQKRLEYQGEDLDTRPIRKKDIEEIQKMMKLIKNEELEGADLEIIKHDISSLTILLNRAFGEDKN